MKAYFLWLAKFLTTIIVFLIGIPLLIGLIAGVGGSLLQSAKPLKESSSPRVAVVELTGEILDSRKIVEQLTDAIEDNSIDGVVLRIDSPGGAVGPSQDIYDAVAQLKERKPIVASMGSVAASGGLYAAMSASKVFAQPGTLTGSIGVIMQIPNVTKIADLVGFQMVTIKSGQMKDIGNTFREMSPEERDFLTTTAGKVHAIFIDAVAKGRNLPREAVSGFADGRVIVGTDAKELGLVDEFGDVFAAARAAITLAGKSIEKNEVPDLVYHKEPLEEFKRMLQNVSHVGAILTGSSHTPVFKFLAQ